MMDCTFCPKGLLCISEISFNSSETNYKSRCKILELTLYYMEQKIRVSSGKLLIMFNFSFLSDDGLAEPLKQLSRSAHKMPNRMCSDSDKQIL